LRFLLVVFSSSFLGLGWGYY